MVRCCGKASVMIRRRCGRGRGIGREAQSGGRPRPPTSPPRYGDATRPMRVGASHGLSGRPRVAAIAPHVDRGEEEQPHHVDEVPVPGGELEAEMLLRREMAEIDPEEADGEEDRADDHVGAVEAGRHEEGRAVDVAFEAEGGVAVLVGLHEVNSTPSTMVSHRPSFRPCRSFCSSAWCAQVTVVPEVSRISVLRSGRCQGSKVSMPFGGQMPPSTSVRWILERVVGDRARRRNRPRTTRRRTSPRRR